jgi:pimeloyl-ACP methyl ester carboxylesterase
MSTALEAQDELFYISRNADSSAPTIIFIHGLSSSHLEFSDVIAILENDYHILAVDLPKHSRSSSIAATEPFTLSLAASFVHSIICNHAHDGRANVVGLSLGGFVALKLTEEHPQAVRRVFVSRAAPFKGVFKWFAERPALIYYGINMFANGIPSWLYNMLASWQGMKRHDELRGEMVSNAKYATVREAYSTILQFTYTNVQKIGATGKRVLTVAGGKQDDVEATRKMGYALRKGGSAESRAAVVKNAVHAWDLQFPELFAEGIKAWINGEDLPQEYQIL